MEAALLKKSQKARVGALENRVQRSRRRSRRPRRRRVGQDLGPTTKLSLISLLSAGFGLGNFD